MRLPELRQRLRGAVAAGNYSETRELLPLYCHAVEETLRNLAPEDPQITSIASDARSILAWARTVIRADRSHLAERLARLSSHRHYPIRCHAGRHTWELRG